MSRASYIFSKIEEHGINFINELINNQDPEELFLDYKRVATSDGAKKISDDDKKNFGKAVSGFGNSDGGVIIWGVDCRTIEGKGDIPSGYQADVSTGKYTFSPNWWKSLLEGLTSGVTVPSPQGVRHFAINRHSKNDGVVATYIPEVAGQIRTAG